MVFGDVVDEHSYKLVAIQDQINMLVAKFDSFTHHPQPFGHSGQKRGVIVALEGELILRGRTQHWFQLLVYGFVVLFWFSQHFDLVLYGFSILFLKYLDILCYGYLDILVIQAMFLCAFVYVAQYFYLMFCIFFSTLVPLLDLVSLMQFKPNASYFSVLASVECWTCK